MKIIGPVILGVVATFVFLQPAQGRGGGHTSFSGGHFSAPSMHFSGGYSRGSSGGRSYYAPSARYSSGATYRNPGYARSYSRTGNRATAYNAGYYSAAGSRPHASRTAAYRNRNYSTANLTSTKTARSRTQGFNQGRVVGRQGGNWHRNWDKNHDHSWHGHRCHWHHNAWIIYDPWPYWWGFGYYPSYPYYSSYDDGYYDNSYSSNEYPQEQHPTETVYDSSRVSQVQSALSREGYYSGAIDGRLNANTRAALRNYQRDHHLAVTGNIDRGILEGLRLR